MSYGIFQESYFRLGISRILKRLLSPRQHTRLNEINKVISNLFVMYQKMYLLHLHFDAELFPTLEVV